MLYDSCEFGQKIFSWNIPDWILAEINTDTRKFLEVILTC